MGDEVSAIGLLGPVTAAGAGAPVDLGGAQRRAVLARLALEPGRVVTLDALIDGLWERPPPTARKTVQVHVSRLRSALPDGAIATAGGGYRLDVDPATVDAQRFATLLATARAAPPEAAIGLLDQALGLWRGPALADVGDVPFAAAVVTHLDATRLEAVEGRIDAHLALDRAAPVVSELEALVHELPLRERFWAQLVTALGLVGRQADAHRAYERARQQLAEVGLSPGEELREAQAGVARDGARPRRAVPSATGLAAVSPFRRFAAPPLLVGRERPREELVAAILAARTGHGAGLVAVRGEEGLGKTALLAAVATDVGGSSTVVLGRCRQHVALPFGPWVDVLEQLGAVDLVALLAPDGDVESAEARRVRLFTGAVGHLREAAAEAPITVVLDDLHWADDGTVDLLLHVLVELEGAPILVIGAWRPGAVAVGRPATRVVSHLTRSGGRAIDLEPLTVDDIGRMLAGHAPEVGPAERPVAAERLLDVTSGVPLFVADALGAAGEGATGLRIDLSRPQVPETARSIVAGRLTEAGLGAVPVAEAAAVLGDDARLEDLVTLTRMAPADLVGAIDDLSRVGLVGDDGAGPRYTHAAFRAAVIEAAPRGRLQALHAAAFALPPLPGAAAVVRAHHAHMAGPLVDDASATEALGAAGAEAAGRGAFSDAVRWYQSAADRAPVTDRPRVRVDLADALWRAGDIAAAKAVAADVVDGALSGRRDPAPPELLVEAAVLHSTVGAGFGPDPASIGLFAAVLPVVDDPLERARLEVGRAYHHAAWGSPAVDAEQAIADARAVLPPDPPDDLEDLLLFAEGLALLSSPDIPARRAQAEHLVARGRARGAARPEGRGLRLRGMAELAAGTLEDLELTTLELEAIARDTGSWMYESDVWRWRAAIALHREDEPGAEAAIAELERLAGSPLAGWVFVGSQKLLLARARGQLDAALAMVEAVRASMPAETAWQTDRRLADLYRLDLLVEMGLDDLAHAELAAMAPWTELHLSSCRRYPAELAMMAVAVGRAGLVEPAADLLARVTPFAGQHVVLGWGEAIIGDFATAIAALGPLVGTAPTAG